MRILEDLNDAEVATLAGSKTPEPMAGVWVLTAPDGQTWTADSPMRVVTKEVNSRVPPQVALARIRRSLTDEEGPAHLCPEPADGLEFDARGVLGPKRDAHRGGDSYEASMLRNLLARIHRDGGHYLEQHGLDKALEDADAQVVQWLTMQDRLADALFVLGMVDKNNRIDAGEKGKAWSGRFVVEEVRRVLAGDPKPEPQNAVRAALG